MYEVVKSYHMQAGRQKLVLCVFYRTHGRQYSNQFQIIYLKNAHIQQTTTYHLSFTSTLFNKTETCTCP